MGNGDSRQKEFFKYGGNLSFQLAKPNFHESEMVSLTVNLNVTHEIPPCEVFFTLVGMEKVMWKEWVHVKRGERTVRRLKKRHG